MRVPRTRGAVSGLVVAVLGLWGALIPFIGPSFNYAIGPTDSWHWTTGRLWLSVLPGVVAIVGGLLLMMSNRRPTASFGALTGVAAGAWFVVGPTVSEWWNDGVSAAGTAHGSRTTQILAVLGWELALGALILFFAATALGRLSVKSVRDIELAEGATADPAAYDQPVATDAVPAGGYAQTPPPLSRQRARGDRPAPDPRTRRGGGTPTPPASS